MAIRGILFDKDGTLIDFNATWLPFAQRLALEAANGDELQAQKLMGKLGFEASIGGFTAGSTMAAGSNRDVMRALYPDLPQQALAARIAQSDMAAADHAMQSAVAVPGAAEAVRALHAAGYRLGVATNDAEQGAHAGMRALGLDPYFDAFIGYDSVANAKPAPDMVLAFARQTGLAPGEIAVTGDNTHDLAMARAAGAGLAIGVLSGNGTRDVLVPLADAVLDSVAALPVFLKRNAPTRTAPEGAVR